MKLSLTIFIFLLIQGCASVQEKPLHDNQVFMSQELNIVISRSDDAKFWLNDLLVEDSFNGLSESELSRQMLDPVLEIEKAVNLRLAQINSTAKISSQTNKRNQGPLNLSSAVAQYKNQDILIDLKSGFWLLNYGEGGKYPIYSMQFHLVDIGNKLLLSSGVCHYDGSKLNNVFTDKQLNQNTEDILNKSKNRVINYCTDYVLGLLNI